MRILLVEDDEALATIVTEALADEGHLTTAVTGWEEAFPLAETQRWDLFIVDAFGESLLQPEERYCATLRRLAEHGPVLVTSGRTWAAHARPEELGASAVLPKPYDLEELSAQVAALAR